VSYA
jgi:hypothetical protein